MPSPTILDTKFLLFFKKIKFQIIFFACFPDLVSWISNLLLFFFFVLDFQKTENSCWSSRYMKFKLIKQFYIGQFVRYILLIKHPSSI